MKKLISVILAILLCCFLFIFAYAESEILNDVKKEAILSALYESDISEIREAIDLQVISCEELTKYYLDRIEQYNKKYNCFITFCDDAVENAKARDEQLQKGENDGLLFGVPIVIKDNMDLSGYYTTDGHKIENLEKEKATVNADAVSFLLNEGAIIIGKTNMSTDAQDARVSYSEIAGETKNAYNTLLASGGSSGGTAVSVSLNFAAAGLGTDTNSSLRLPAILSGCVSLRPTFNLIPTKGVTRLNGSRDVVGAISRTVYDQAIMMDVLTNREYNYTENLNKDAINGLKIGIFSDLTYPITNLNDYDTSALSQRTVNELNDRAKKSNFDSEILTAFENAVKELEKCGAEVVTVSMPDFYALSDVTFSTSETAPKRALYDAFKKMLDENGIDAIIYPTYSSTPLKSGTDENGKYWNPWNQVFINNCRNLSPSASIPEISVPIGYHSSGAGIGMEIASLKNSEQLLLDIAYSYTENYNHRSLPKGAPDSYSNFNEGTLTEIIDKYFLTSADATVNDSPLGSIQSDCKTDLSENPKINIFSILFPVVLIILVLLVGITIHIIIKKKNINRQ